MEVPKILSKEGMAILAEYYMSNTFDIIQNYIYHYGLALFVLLITLVIIVTIVFFCHNASTKRLICSKKLEKIDNPEDDCTNIKYKYGVAVDQNMRNYQEDRYCVHHCFIDNKPFTFYAVFDGHGGCHASQYCATMLYSNILTSPNFPNDINAAITDGFVNTDTNYHSISSSINAQDGTTVCVCIIYDGSIYMAHAGDSRCVIVSKDKNVYFSTHDHKPNRTDEKERILNRGGKVILWGVWRVDGILAVSRSIGDYDLKHYVIPNPEIITVPLTNYNYIHSEENTDDDHKTQKVIITNTTSTVNSNPSYIVLATDGLWDTINSTEIGEWIYSWVKDSNTNLQDISSRLIQAAKYRGSDDNITVLTVAVDPFLFTSSTEVLKSDSVTENDTITKNNSSSIHDKATVTDDKMNEELSSSSSTNTVLETKEMDSNSTTSCTLPKRDSTPNLDAYNVENAIEEEEQNENSDILEDDNDIYNKEIYNEIDKETSLHYEDIKRNILDSNNIVSPNQNQE